MAKPRALKWVQFFVVSRNFMCQMWMQMIRKTWTWLAEQPEDAAELAQLLFEATPRLGVSASQSSSPRRSMTTRFSKRSVPGASLSLLDRLKAAEPMATGRTLVCAVAESSCSI